MKKIYSLALLLLMGAVALTSCKDDRDSNPTLTQPTEFSITGSSATAATIDLEQTKEFTVSWTLPVYTNFGNLQCSLSGSRTYTKNQRLSGITAHRLA